MFVFKINFYCPLLCLLMWVYAVSVGALGLMYQRTELQGLVSYLTWVLETELGSSAISLDLMKMQ